MHKHIMNNEKVAYIDKKIEYDYFTVTITYGNINEINEFNTLYEKGKINFINSKQCICYRRKQNEIKSDVTLYKDVYMTLKNNKYKIYERDHHNDEWVLVNG